MVGSLGVVAFAGGGLKYDSWINEMASLDPAIYPGLSDPASVYLPSLHLYHFS